MVKSLQKHKLDEPEGGRRAWVHDFRCGCPDDYIDGTDARGFFGPRALDEED